MSRWPLNRLRFVIFLRCDPQTAFPLRLRRRPHFFRHSARAFVCGAGIETSVLKGCSIALVQLPADDCQDGWAFKQTLSITELCHGHPILSYREVLADLKKQGYHVQRITAIPQERERVRTTGH